MKEKYDVKLEGKEWKDCLKQAFNKKKKDKETNYLLFSQYICRNFNDRRNFLFLL